MTDKTDNAWAINGRFLSQPATGVQRYAFEVVCALDELDALRPGEATLYVPDGSRSPRSALRLATRHIAGTGSQLWEQVRLPRAESGPLLSLCNRGPLLSNRQIVCIHDTNVINCPDSYSTAFRIAYRALLPLFARRAAGLTTVSHFSAGEIARHFGVPRERITVLHNGHEHVHRWNAEKSDVLQRCGLDRPFVLTIGSRAKHKNLGLLLKLAASLNELNLDLVVAGGGGRIFSDSEEAIPANVRILGHVSDDDLARLLSTCLCLAFPSLTEGFGLPVVEALAVGCPVVSSSAASMPEVCGDAALLAPPDDPSAWLTKFKLLSGSKAIQAELREKGPVQARRFSWQRSAAGYLDLMRTLG